MNAELSFEYIRRYLMIENKKIFPYVKICGSNLSQNALNNLSNCIDSLVDEKEPVLFAFNLEILVKQCFFQNLFQFIHVFDQQNVFANF